MKTEITVKKEVDIRTLVVEAAPRYWEDATVDGVEDSEGGLIPCRKGDLWCPIIDIDSGKIRNWKKGVTAKVHYKVCDCGSYYLQDEQGNNLLSIEQDYVPSILSPEGSGYGDYIKMNINADGQICNWKIDITSFQNED